MKIKMNELTRHAKEDRKERRNIAKQVGIGTVIAQMRKEGGTETRYKVQMLTDTGLMIIMGEDGKIITLYLARLAQAIGFYKTVHNGKSFPDRVYQQIKINNVFFAAD